MASREIQKVRFKHPDGDRALFQVVELAELRSRKPPELYLPQRRDFHVIHLVTSGKGCHHFEFGLVQLSEGDVFSVRAGQVDWYDDGSDHNALLLIFLPEATPALNLPRLSLSNPLRPSPRDFGRMLSLARLIDSFRAEPPFEDAALCLLRGAVSLFSSLVGGAVATQHSARRVSLCERFDELLESHMRSQRSATWYAERLGVAAKTLGRATESVLDCTAKQHIDRNVTLEAKRLLIHTDVTVDEVAVTLGFDESTNFVKFFRRVESCTPRAFRDRFRPAESP